MDRRSGETQGRCSGTNTVNGHAPAASRRTDGFVLSAVVADHWVNEANDNGVG